MGPALQILLAPLAARFLQKHPDAALTDILQAGFDAGVCFGEELAQDMVALPIGPS